MSQRSKECMEDSKQLRPTQLKLQEGEEWKIRLAQLIEALEALRLD